MRVASGSAAPICSPASTEMDAAEHVPPFASNMTVYLGTAVSVHCAWYVTSAVTFVEADIFVPPVAAVNQPLNS